MAPEYAMEGSFSVKSDVFSFGVIILEIISGKKNASSHTQSQYANGLLSSVSCDIHVCVCISLNLYWINITDDIVNCGKRFNSSINIIVIGLEAMEGG